MTQLKTLSLNTNPLGTIPPFNITKLQTLSLQDTSLTSAKFPDSYATCSVQRISLNNNKIPSITADDFTSLKNSQVKRLNIDSSAVSSIDQNAFTPLSDLQSLSLQRNLLKTASFISSVRSLASVELDGNQFTQLPQELAAPKTLRIFSFTNNSIAVIDESSPLHAWTKINVTGLKINLTNNPFDCCQSLWFIRFLSTSSQFVPDAAQLKCARPANYAGQLLIKLNPDMMACGQPSPSQSWWTIDRIIGVSIGGILITVLAITGGIFLFRRQQRLRSGYVEIDGSVDPSPPTAPPLPSSHLPFPPYGEEEDDDDAGSSISAAVTTHASASHAPTYSAIGGHSHVNSNRN